jgi:diguanylate cyclase (GGDEF)-like protein/PAS domain S-box-containing protein
VTIGLVVSAVATISSWQHAELTAKADQQAHAAMASAELRAVTGQAIARLDDLAVTIAVAHREDGAFDALAGRVYRETPFAALGYVVRVPSARRASFRAERGAEIRARSTKLLPAGAGGGAAFLYPAIRAVGAHRGLFEAGVDTVSPAPWIKSVLLQAEDMNETRASMPGDLPEPIGLSTMVVAPVRQGEWVIGVLPVDAVVGEVQTGVPDARLALHGAGARPGGELEQWRAPLTRQVDVGGRAWTLVVGRPSPPAGRTIAIAIITLLLTLVLGLASRLGTRRERLAEAGRLAAEERSRRLAETSTDMLVVHGARGRLEYLSPACRELLGRDPEELLGGTPEWLMHPEDRHHVAAAIAEIAAGADTLTVTLRLRRADDTWVWVETRLRVLRDELGRPVEAHSTVRDISDRMAAKTAIEEAEARFRSTFEEAPIGMAITSPDGHYQRVNRSLARLLGYPRSALEGRHVNTITHPDDRAGDNDGMAAMLAGTTDSFRTEKRYLHANGEAVWTMLSSTLVRGQDGTPLYFLSQMLDVTERRRYEAELRHLADHDPLTGLLNRRSFERELARHVARVERYGARGAALVLDLDHFKFINDTLGHGVGDDLITRVAAALRSRLRETDVLARLGGDEFAVLMPEGGREDAAEVARGVLQAVRGQAVLATSGHARRVSASIGVALFTDERLTGDAVLVRADLAMYEAKEAGRDRYAIAEGGTSEGPLGAHFSWADVIRDALAEDRFVLHAQPIVDMDSGRIGQYELLLRMVDTDGEVIGPGRFLPVAERFDLIGDLDRWVVRRAIAMLAEATAAGHDITVEVNLSGRSTGDTELLALIEEQLRDSAVDPARLIFEITETTAVSNIPAAQHFSSRLADLGCRFALDDFGAGFGSFYYLKHLPFDYLKIDGEFVRECAQNRTDQLVIEAVVGIARGLGKRTVAEQAGDDATLQLLREMGVDQAQGYFIGGPAPLEEWLARAAPTDPARPAALQRL